MTTKSLGQIASETMASLRAQASAEELSDPAAQAERWEAVARTIAAIACDQCWKACEDERLHTQPPQHVDDIAYEMAITDCQSAIAAIRSIVI